MSSVKKSAPSSRIHKQILLYLNTMKMDKDTYKSNLKTLKEIILDEQKLVTYISLSKELCIHVNDAKTLLNDIVQDIRKTEPKTEIYVCYMISGLLNNSSACTTVCPEAEIEDLRKKLSNIFYEHVYCVSRGMQAVDNVALTLINKFEDFSLCTGLIKANSCIKRTDDEILNLKSSSNHGITIESKANNAITKNSTEKKKEVMKNGHDNVKKPIEVKSEPVIKKTPSPKKDVTTNDKTSVKKNGTKSVAKGIAGFFSKANGDTKKTTNTKVKEEKQKQVKEQNEVPVKVEKEIKVKIEPDTPVKTKKEDSKNKSKENSTDKKSSKNSLKQIKKHAKVDKKRKRVLHVSDSDSETETNDPFADDEDKKMVVDQDSEDEIPPTPTTNTVKITSGIVNPKKRRKIVDKTYTDEDGYILTKKEEVYESCSDNEEVTKVNVKQEKENIVQVTQVKTETKETSPKENGKSKKRKISPPQKGKQQMLTNFFKKV